MKKISDTIVYMNERYYCAFPSLIQKSDGELICAFRRAPSRQRVWGNPNDIHCDSNSYLVKVNSKDNGKSWSAEPELVFAHPWGGSQDPCLSLMPDGSIVCASYGWALTVPEVHNKLPKTMHHALYYFIGGYIIRSDDGGKTWKGPYSPPHLPQDGTEDIFNNPCPAYNRGEMLACKDGRLLWAVVANHKADMRLSSVHLLESSDKGETWTYRCPIAEDDAVCFNETSLAETINGDIIAFMRTVNLDGKLAVAVSTDGGNSFEPWQDGVIFGHPFQATRLKDGRVFLVYGYRKEPFGIRSKLLNPDCTNFADAPELVIRDDGGNVDLGYPWSVQLPDESIYVVYYINVGGGQRHIAGSQIVID